MSCIELPDEVRLNGVTISIERVKDLKDEEGDPANGLASIDELTIELSSGIRGHDTLRFILLHEVAHFMEDHAGLKLKESQIDSIARSVLSLVRDNPELIAWLGLPKPVRKRLKGNDDTPTPEGDRPADH